jgi:hypothetical protein
LTGSSPGSEVYGTTATFSSALSGGLTTPPSDVPTGSITAKIYNNDTCTGTPVLTETNSSIDGNSPPSYTDGSGVLPGVGTYYGEATYSGDMYNATSTSGCNELLTVTPAPLKIIAPTLTTTYGTIPTLVPTYVGFVNGDTPASLSVLPYCTTTATATSSPGTYPVKCSGAVDPNYTITYKAGSIKIVAAPTSWTIAEHITGTKTFTDVLSEIGLPSNAVGTVYLETGTGVACAFILTGKPGEVTSCQVNFGSNLPIEIYGVFVDEDGNYADSHSTNTLYPRA